MIAHAPDNTGRNVNDGPSAADDADITPTVMKDKTYDTGFAAAFAKGNTTTKADLFSRAKIAIEAGDQSPHEAADALALAQEDFNATQREIAEAVGKSAAWVNRLLRWRREGCPGSPFGPGSKAGRERRTCVQSTEQRAPRKVDTDSPETSTEKGKTENAGQGADPKSQAGDVALIDFTARVLDLITRTDKRPPEHFSATAVPADDLAKLGKFLTDIANVKKSETVEPATDHGSNGGVP
jgi:hypothetical protein